LWAFSVYDLAKLFDMTPEAVRQAIHRKSFDPTDLESLYLYKRTKRHPLKEDQGPRGP
jgi:hypothetical protein